MARRFRMVSGGSGRGGGEGNGVLSRLFRQTPVTGAILAATVAMLLVRVFLAGVAPIGRLAFSPSAALSSPWSFFTYPFVPTDRPFWLLLMLYWAWMVGTELEAKIGSARYAGLFFGSGAFSAAGCLLGFLATKREVPLIGLAVPLSAVTVAWGLRNPGRTILFSFLIPIPGSILAWLTAVLLYLDYGLAVGPLAALFPMAGLLFSVVLTKGTRALLPGRRGIDWASPRRGGERLPSLTLLERFRLWRARRRMKKVWDADDIVN